MPLQPFGGDAGFDPMDLLKLGLQSRSQQLDALRMVREQQRFDERMTFDKLERQRLLDEEAAKQAAAEEARGVRSRTAEGALGLASQWGEVPLATQESANLQDYLAGADPTERKAILDYYQGQRNPKFLGQFTGGEGPGAILQDQRTGEVYPQNLGVGASPSSEFPRDSVLYSMTMADKAAGKTVEPWREVHRINYELGLTKPTYFNKETKDAAGNKVVQRVARSRTPSGEFNEEVVDSWESPANLPSPVRAAIANRLVTSQAQMSAVMNNARALMASPEITSIPQGIANMMTGFYSRILDPSFDPSQYEGAFQDLVRNAPVSEAVKADMGRTFQVEYRKPTTGAQSALQEIEVLLADWPNKKDSLWRALAKSAAIVKREMEIFNAYKKGYESGTIPMLVDQDEANNFMNEVRTLSVPQGMGQPSAEPNPSALKVY